MIPDSKLCPSCNIKKDKSEFHTRKDKGYVYLKSYCKLCSKTKNQQDLRSDRHYDECECGNRKCKKSPTCKVCLRYKHEELFIADCSIPRKIVKRAIIRDKVIPHECQECGNAGEYNGRPLTLQLDHINGVNNDNRIENLRFLCPNCHSQTDTFCGGNKSSGTGI